ncbi:MAG: tRNA pseudouridine(55) synthase TruB [Deltaproteobacteria bacterium]|nr:tRNA pseudouridine(55) synthase TruB [Deltaproteobacteria bacterium]
MVPNREPEPVADGPEPCGVLIIDKPLGWTSRDIVNKVGRLLGTRSAGHAGTLDPQASGVLAVAMGEATKLVPRLMDAGKTYEAEISFGAATLTDDATGRIVRQAAVPRPLDKARVQATLDRWLGTHMQVPPQVSALQRDGVRDHKRVRQGETVVRAPRPVRFDAAEVLAVVGPVVRVRLQVGSGFYVRALARDLGEALGSAAHLTGLRRTAGCGFALAESVTLDALVAMSADARHAALLPLLAVAGRLLPIAQVDAATALGLRQGRRVPWLGKDGTELLAVHDETAVAVARIDAGALLVVRGFAHPNLQRAAVESQRKADPAATAA